MLPRHALNGAGKHQAIGQSGWHPEFEAIVTGQMTYTRDVSIPDMAYVAVIYPPASGTRFTKADPAKARAIPGIIGVDINKGDGFVGVVADNPFVHADAIEALSAQWQVDENFYQPEIDVRIDVEKIRTDDDFDHTLLSSGDLDTGRKNAKHRVAGRHDTPFMAHTAIEPRSGLVWVRDDKAGVCCGTQDPYFVQKRVAKIVGRRVDDVIIHTHRRRGGFGGRAPCQASEVAARLLATFNRPVRVQWDRETEFQNNYFQPGFSHYIDASITADGTISHWNHDVVSPSIFTGLTPDFVGKVIEMAKADGGTVRGIIPQYTMPDRRIRYSAARTAVPVNARRDCQRNFCGNRAVQPTPADDV